MAAVSSNPPASNATQEDDLPEVRSTIEAEKPGLTPISVSMADAATLSGLSRSMLYVYAKAGKLPLRKVGGRSLVLVEDLRRLIVGGA